MLKAGLVITLALITLFLGAIFTGTIGGILAPAIEFRAQFRDVKGLRKGAPVWLFGTEVGSVKSIQLAPAYGTIATLLVKKNAVPFIMSDSHAEILTMGLLGDKYIELTSGSPAAGPIHPGEMIKGTTPAELTSIVEASTKTIEKVSELVNKLEKLIAGIAEGHGSLAKLINEPTLYDNIEKSAAILYSTLERIEKSGTLKKLIENPELYDHLDKSAEHLDSILKRINSGKGMAGALVQDETLVAEVKGMLLEIQGLAGEVKILLNDIKEHPQEYFKFSLF